jgi:hypothetical protein
MADQQKTYRTEPPADVITPEEPVTRLRGSTPTRQGRGALGTGGARNPGTGVGKSLPNLPGISTPDLAFQFKPCVPAELTTTVKDRVMADVTGAVDVRIGCAGDTCTIAIWMSPALGSLDSVDRDLGLESLRLLQSGENYAAFINGTLIKARAQDDFAKRPKRLDGDGNASDDGPVHLTGLNVDFQPPNCVITTIDGFDERPWPDVDFEITITETLSASAGALQVTPVSALDTDTSWLSVLTAIMGVLTHSDSGLFAIGLAIFGTQDVVVTGASAPTGIAGAGSAAKNLPAEVMIPGKLKFVMDYERVQVSSGGIFAGGSMALANRVPSIAISELGILETIGKEAPNTRTYYVQSVDMLAPETFAWTSDGVLEDATAAEAVVRFSLPQHQLQVQVTDVDGFVRQASKTIHLI